MLEPINPAHIPVNPFYSQAMLVPAGGRTLYVSGQVGIGADGRPAEGIAAQTGAAIANLAAVLESAGMTPAKIAKMTIYLTDPEDVDGFSQAAGASLPSPPPATTLLIVKALAMPQLRVEIEAIAVG